MMSLRTFRLVFACACAVLLGSALGCARPSAPVETPAPPAGEPTAGLRLAPGLYDQPDGTVLAIGTLEHSDLEGGFWLVSDGTKAAGDASATVVVIANGADLESTLAPLAGKQVEVKGTRLDGVSIRMAGPEMTATEVAEITDTPGIAE